jgi:hypothetical protein
MYQPDHPYFRDALESFFTVAEDLINQMSPLVFILSQERFFIDEEPLDPRINVSRLVTYFKKAGIQSVSFYKGLRKNELRQFMEVFTSIQQYPDADAMIRAIEQKGIRHLRINHVYYQKVTSDDEVVSRDALKKMTPEMSSEAERKSKKMFMDALLENVLTEEFEKTLSVRNLMANPSEVSRNMIDNDLAAVEAGGGAGDVSGGAAPEGVGGQGASPGTGASPAAGPPSGQSAVAGAEPGSGAGAGTGMGPGTGSGTGPAGGTSEGAPAGTAAGPGAGTGGPGASPGAGPDERTGEGPGARPGTGSSGEAAPGADARGSGTPDEGTGPAGPVSTVEGGTGEGGATAQPGTMLAHQLDLISSEIEKSLSGESDVDLQDLAMAVFQMKTELVQGIESQKALGIAYENETAILEKANELTDRVLLQIVKDEYRAGNVTTGRMAQILRRLVPEPGELKRLLPKFKTALLEAGMPLADYLQLIKDLGRELQDEGLARVLQEAGEQVGVDGDALIEEIKKDPKQAAELMSIAAEIRKGRGDEQALTDILVDYVEKLGADLGRDATSAGDGGSDGHLRNVITGVESKLVRHLREMDVQEDVLSRIESKLNERLDSIVDKIKLDYMRSTGLDIGGKEIEELTVLQTLERSVSESDELGVLLKAVRRRADAGGLDEDDFARIYAEIERQKQVRIEQEANREMPPGVLTQANLKLFIDKEISKAARYELPFSALAFTVVRAAFKEKRPGKKIPARALLDRVLHRLAQIVRDTDLVGTVRKNQMIALLPLTPLGDAKLALKRSMKILHNEPFELEGFTLDVKLAGTAVTFQKGRTPDSDAFLEALSSDLTEMANRVRNIHALM